MRSSVWTSMSPVIVVLVLMSAASIRMAGQSATTAKRAAAATKAWTPTRTAWGDPDLQGQWNSQTSTPLERPLTGPLAGKEALSEEEAQNLEEENRKSIDSAPREGDPGTYNAFWRDRGKALTRTSLIVDPPDGRVPP